MSIRYFDAHTHVQFAAFDEDREAVFARAKEAGVGMNLVGTQADTSRAAVECAHSHEGVWATIGLHPIHTSKSHHDVQELGEGGKAPGRPDGGFMSRGEEFDMSVYEEFARDPKTIAIGECGLDYYRLDEDSKKRQVETFISHIELANTVGKPLMLHIRSGARGEAGNGAYEDALALLQEHAKVQGDVHFFAGTWETAQKFLSLGFTLSFTGVITFAREYEEVVRNTPLDMLLVETDAPYVTPAPNRGKRNEPAYIPDIVRKVADIKELDEEEVRSQILKNVERVFNISLS